MPAMVSEEETRGKGGGREMEGLFNLTRIDSVLSTNGSESVMFVVATHEGARLEEEEEPELEEEVDYQ